MRRIYILLLLFAVFFNAHAQKESGLWLGVDATHDFSKKWSTEIGIGSRLEDDWSRFTRYDAALGFSYKPYKWLKFGAGYDFIRDYCSAENSLKYKKNDDGSIRYDSDGNAVVRGWVRDEAYWRSKHRFYFDVTGKLKAGRFTFSLRERYQYTFSAKASYTKKKFYEELDEDDFEDYTGEYFGPYTDKYGDLYYYGIENPDVDIEDATKNVKHKHYLRSRIGAEYNIRHCPVTPFANYEIANDLGDGLSVVRHRVQAGIDWKVAKGHNVSAAYLFQHGAKEEIGDANLHVLSIGYQFKF